jgi:hypothetical protein
MLKASAQAADGGRPAEIGVILAGRMAQRLFEDEAALTRQYTCSERTGAGLLIFA